MGAACAMGAGQTVVSIDASAPAPAVQPLWFPAGGKSPVGHELGVNNRYLTLDGKPWLPVMGEMHYSRYPEREWETELVKMKMGGLQIVGTYVFWIHHEEIEGQFDWSGQRNLRRFVQLCDKVGLKVWMRIGPWAHGEVRNGGFPDWLLKAGPTRQNDPEYLEHVRRFYGEIGAQLKGLMWNNDGPVIGVQLENEYTPRGPGKGAEHILTLRQMAREAGIVAPFYTVTGWDGVEVPERDVIPVFGGYQDAFWDRKVTELPPNPNYFFTTIRCEENVGDDLRSKHPEIDARYAAYPFFTAEMGGGMETAYHRRPVMSADDIAAPLVTKIGSGVNLYGYYMYHGGTNPEGRLTTLQESQATGYWNDVPVKSYDFQAPLGEFGERRPSFGSLAIFHRFLAQFGSVLAPMTAYFPDERPASRADTTTPRVSARVEGDRGFVFLNNYQRNYPLAAHRGLRITLKMASETVEFPAVDVPSGAYFIWPVNLDLDGVPLKYATAQPEGQVSGIYSFVTWQGVAAEFAFDARLVDRIEVSGASVVKTGGLIRVREMKTDLPMTVRGKNGKSVRIVLQKRESNLAAPAPDRAPLNAKLLRPAAPSHPVKIAMVAQAPEDADFERAGVWRVPVPEDTREGWLEVNYTGDVARAYVNGRLVTDNFYNGTPWDIGHLSDAREVEIRILPLRKDAPIYIPKEFRPEEDEVARVNSVVWVR
jgi:hypothetical protein